jgi:D-alanyl-lipoteichoic acid acyltransferase DltB (MBOAT superfamily)
MQFNSCSYILLILAAAGLFWVLPPVVRRWYVLALSIGYYATWNPAHIAVPLLLCAGVYMTARQLIRDPRNAGLWFRAGISWALLLLLFFRYRQFLLDIANPLLARLGVAPLTIAAIAVPLGISFYTFEAISYLIDAKQGRVKQTRFTELFLFIMFWPHLMAGPIVRFRELIPQLDFTRKFDLSMLLRGLDRLVWGLVQKNLLANSLGGWVDAGFLPNTIRSHTTLDNWTLAAAFGLQIYFDFAAYSNMAVGVAQLIGVTLPENFRFPYHAQTPPEFWNRWHMTLSRWIRDYLFFPVNARFRGASVPLYISLVGIMGLVGLWHGAGWGFVLWGLMHGVYMVLYRIWETVRGKRFPGLAHSTVIAWAWRIFTLAGVTAAWVPFRAATAADIFQMLGSMFAHFRFGISFAINFYLVTLLLMLFCVVEPFLAAAWNRLHTAAASYRVLHQASVFLVRPAIYALGLLFFLIFSDRDTQFIYFQF